MFWNIQPNFLKAKALRSLFAAKILPEHFIHSALCLNAVNKRLPKQYSRGFTLLELLVVISLLGLLSVALVLSLDSAQDDAKIKLTNIEMSELRKALLQFKRDVGGFPSLNINAALPVADQEADLLARNAINSGRLANQLFYCTDGDANKDGVIDALDNNSIHLNSRCTAWNVDTSRGWNGLYATPKQIEGETERGFFDQWGNRYLLLNLDETQPGLGVARIASSGPDGVLETYVSGGECQKQGDDYIVCLVQ